MQPSKKAKNSGGKGSVVMLNSQNNRVSYSRIRSHRRILFNGRAEIWGQIAPSHSPKTHYTFFKKSGHNVSIKMSYTKV